jgi:hypothetical protein
MSAQLDRGSQQPKRFFDAASIATLFAKGWKISSQRHLVTRKYVKAKALWELAVVKRV